MRYNFSLTNSTQFGNDSNYSEFNGENIATNCSRVTVLALDGLKERNTLAHYALLKIFSLRSPSTCCNIGLELAVVSEHTFQSPALTSIGFKKSLQSLQEVETSSAASITQCNFACNLRCIGVARQVAGRLQHVTYPLYNLSHNFFGLATIAQSGAWFYFLQRLCECLFESSASCSSTLQRVTCRLQLVMNLFIQRCEISYKKYCIVYR